MAYRDGGLRFKDSHPSPTDDSIFSEHVAKFYSNACKLAYLLLAFFPANEGLCVLYRETYCLHICFVLKAKVNKKAQLSLTNPRDACEKFARFT